MSTLTEPKKTAQDWHRADIIAALHKAGWSLRQLSLQHGYSQESVYRLKKFGRGDLLSVALKNSLRERSKELL